MKHRLHVVSLPHTQTTLEFSSCAYTEKVRKFCRMMVEQGNEVLLSKSRPRRKKKSKRGQPTGETSSSF